jgi:LmbE family N-acetylglucosaminyl deacetylase
VLEPTLELRRDIARVIRQVRPHRVVAPSPERNDQRVVASHPDHLAAGEAALCAVYPDARNPFTFTELAAEGLEAWSVSEVWMMWGSWPSEPDSMAGPPAVAAKVSPRVGSWMTDAQLGPMTGTLRSAARSPRRDLPNRPDP